MLLPTVEAMESKLPRPTNVEAAAILQAWNERAIPLPLQDVPDWYGSGGRYWQLRWMTAGFTSEGDKMHGATDLWWALAMSPANARTFWAQLRDLADASDRWQLAQGADVLPPSVNVPALLHRNGTWDNLYKIRPIWKMKTSPSADALNRYIKEGWEKLKEWRKRRQADPSRPPLPPPLPSPPSGGTLLMIALGLLLLGGPRSTSPRRR